MISVLLVDDHASIRTSLCYLLEATDDIKVVATASNGFEAVAQAISLFPDVVVMDISMPVMNGIEATGQILSHCPHTRVMMISTYESPQYIQHSLQVGASGYVLKDTDTVGSELLDAVRALYSGSQFFSQKIAEIAQNFLHEKGNDSGAEYTSEKL